MTMSEGYVHSIESGSFVDGPGVRYVVFLSGCPLRCAYCHNPDTWQRGTETTTSDEVLAAIERTAPFLKAGDGGVTVSGGEPLAQASFAHDILHGAKRLGLHTALDTSGYLGARATDEMLGDIDLVLLDIKSWDPEVYKDVTGVEVEPTLRFARRLSDMCKPAWIRFVLVPGLTDDPANVEGLAAFIGTLVNVERVEIIPFHQMGKRKWEGLCLPYRLNATQPPSEEDLQRVHRVFEAHGLPLEIGRFPPCGPADGQGDG